MDTIANQMISALLGKYLEDELEALDRADGSASLFHAASRTLHMTDYKALVIAARKRVEKFKKEAGGCPSRIFGWKEHYNKKFEPSNVQGEALPIDTGAKKR